MERGQAEEPVTGVPWGRWVVGIGALVTLILITMYAARTLPARGGLEAVTAELDATDPGWRLADIIAARPQIPPEENAAWRVVALAKSIPLGWPDDAAMAALDGPANRRPSAAALSTLLKGLPRADARALGRLPRGAFDAPPAATGLWAPAPELDLSAVVLKLIDLDARALARDGNADDALASAGVLLKLGAALDVDPLIAGQMLRVWGRQAGWAAAERVLALCEPSDAALASLDVSPADVTQAVRVQRAMTHQTLEAIGRGERSPAEVFGSMNIVVPVSFRLGGLAGVRREHPRLLRMMTRLTDVTRLPPPRQYAEEDAIRRDFGPSAGEFTKLVLSVHAGNALGREHAARAAAFRALIAAERYRLKHGKWPATLTDAMPVVPDDPIGGGPIRFVRTADGVVVYSVGDDRADGGGAIDAAGGDVGYRGWDADKRGVP